MVLAAAVISLVVAASEADGRAVQAQSVPTQSATTDESPPYTVAGVRRAYAAPNRETVFAPTADAERRGYRVWVESGVPDASICTGLVVPMECRLSRSRPGYPTWHDQFVAMAGPQGYDVPYSAMNNVQRVEAIATSVGITLAFQALYSLVAHGVDAYRADRKQAKIERTRAEIRAEVEELERANAAARGSVPPPVR